MLLFPSAHHSRVVTSAAAAVAVSQLLQLELSRDNERHLSGARAITSKSSLSSLGPSHFASSTIYNFGAKLTHLHKQMQTTPGMTATPMQTSAVWPGCQVTMNAPTLLTNATTSCLNHFLLYALSIHAYGN